MGKKMDTIYKIFKSKHKLRTGLGEIGIEIETEVLSHDLYPKNFFGDAQVGIDNHGNSKKYWLPKSLPEWKAVEDGSLRNFGMEFVLKEPLDYPLAVAALANFGAATKDIPFIKNAPATSVHVHLNITDFTPLQLVNLITILSLTENLLTEYSGPTRRANTFARPIRCAEGFLDAVYDLISKLETGNMGAIYFAEHTHKYATINFATLAKYGSIEVRCFRGTTDPKEIIDWISILHEAYNFARTPFLTPSDLYKTYQEVEEGVVDLIFGSQADRLKCENYIDLLRRNEWYLASISMMSQDWNSLASKYDKSKKKIEIPPDPAQFAALYGGMTVFTVNGLTAAQQQFFDPSSGDVVVLDNDVPEPYDEDEYLSQQEDDVMSDFEEDEYP